MSDQNLFLPICGSLIFLFIILAAIFGMGARLRFAKRLRNAYKDKENIIAWQKAHKSRQRLLLLVSLISVSGLIILGGLILIGILVVSMNSLVIFATLIIVGLISGILLLRDLEKLVK